MKLVLKDSSDIHWENFEFWIIKSLSVFLFWVAAKIGFSFRKGLGLDPGPVFKLLSLKPTIVEGLHKGWLIQMNNSAVYET